MTDPTTFIIDDVTFEGTLSIEIMEGTSVEIKACIFNSSDPVVIKAIPRVSNSDLEETKLALEKLEADLATQSAPHSPQSTSSTSHQ